MYLKLAKFKEASEKYQQALTISKKSATYPPSKTADILIALGQIDKKCNDYEKAIKV